MIPLIDSLAHPTVSGKWFNQGLEASFSSLIEDMKKANFIAACAVGLAGIENYSHELFIKECNKYKSLIPIAGVNPKSAIKIDEEISYIKKLGYKGIKIHPRYSLIDFEDDNLVKVFKSAAVHNLVVFFCTYNHSKVENYVEYDPFYSLIKILKKAQDTRVVLVHGGNIELLRYAELVRFNPNLLLDLSLTIIKYKGSSIDMDIKFLFDNFDQRISIGSDYPEYSHSALRERFDFFSQDLTKEKKENIAYKNLIDFLTLNEIEMATKLFQKSK